MNWEFDKDFLPRAPALSTAPSVFPAPPSFPLPARLFGPQTVRCLCSGIQVNGHHVMHAHAGAHIKSFFRAPGSPQTRRRERRPGPGAAGTAALLHPAAAHPVPPRWACGEIRGKAGGLRGSRACYLLRRQAIAGWLRVWGGRAGDGVQKVPFTSRGSRGGAGAESSSLPRSHVG